MQPDDEPTDAAIIWLHGFSETGKAWHKRFIDDAFLDSRLPWVEWYFPDAPAQSWFKVQLPVWDSSKEPEGLDNAVAAVHKMLAEVESTGVKPSRIFLGGYGSGAALALLAGRKYGSALAGIAVMSGWFLRPQEQSSSARTPVLLCHGEEDDDVPFELYEEACVCLGREKCWRLTKHTYENFGHKECADEITVLAAPKNFMTACLPPTHDQSASRAASHAASRRAQQQVSSSSNEKPNAPARAPATAAAASGFPEPMDEAAMDRLATASAARLVDMALGQQSAAEAEHAAAALTRTCELHSISEVVDADAPALHVVLALHGVGSMADVDLSVGETSIEVQLGAGSKPFVVPLPKPVQAGSGKAKFARKTGHLKLNLRLA